MPRRGIDLTEDQWARVKSHAATRRQTISQYLGDVVDEILPDGHVRPQTTTMSGTMAKDNVNTVSGPLLDPDVRASVRATTKAESYIPGMTDFGSSRPAPKPGKKK